jgi:hypothetical protein
MQEEIWKEVPGYNGMYLVSNLGNVKSIDRYKKYQDIEIFIKGKILKGRLGGRENKQYLSVVLCDNKHRKNYQIHQLVAMAFLGHIPCGHKLVVDHINDNQLDNRLENLQIVTARFNSYKTQGNYSSKYKGVSWCKVKKKWRTRARNKGKEIMIGYFNNEEEAGNAYVKYCNENFYLQRIGALRSSP